MRTLVALLLTYLALSACGDGGDRAPRALSATASAPAGAVLSGAQAQAALDRALLLLRTDGTGRFASLTDIGGEGSIAYRGTFRLDPPLWEGTLAFRLGPPADHGDILTIGTPGATYLTSPQWPEDKRGRWFAQVRDQPGAAAGSGQGLPMPIVSPFDTKATSATRTSAGTTIRGTLPAGDVLLLASLQRAMTELDVDPSRLTAPVPVTLTLSPDGRMSGFRMEPGALRDVASSLPGFLAEIARQVELSVTLDGFRQSVSIVVPTGKQILPAGEK